MQRLNITIESEVCKRTSGGAEACGWLVGEDKELLLSFAFNGMLHSVENVVDSDLGGEPWLGAVLIDASADQDRVPVHVRLLVKLVGAADIRLRGVTDEIDGVRRRVDAVGVLPPLSEESGGEL